MGKYMRKAKIRSEASPKPSPLGVRTRAKTLALRNFPEVSEDSSAYLQLRSRRLEKPFLKSGNSSKLRNSNFSPSPEVSSNKLEESPLNSGTARRVFELSVEIPVENDCGVEASFGENVLEFEPTRRSRETTPCSLIRDPETVRTPGSTTRQTTSAVNARRIQPPETCDIPTAQDMDEFFAGPEQAQQRRFAQKYNFDPVNEMPLAGRYEWEKLDV